MYLNNFSARVTGGNENVSGYIEIAHGKQYTIVLRNDHNVRCNAEVNIDGKLMGTFRIAANSTMRLERKPDDDGRFTFYRLGSAEAGKSDLGSVSENDLGLLKIVFTPESMPTTTYTNYPWTYTDPWTRPTSMWDDVTTDDPNVWRDTVTCKGSSSSLTCSSMLDSAPGGTGLSGHSDQGFIKVEDMLLDYTQQTTIHLRLVEERKQKDPRPLRPVMNSSPIPPPVSGSEE